MAACEIAIAKERVQPAVRHIARIEIIDELDMAEAAREIGKPRRFEHFGMIAGEIAEFVRGEELAVSVDRRAP